ncbi:hypothetical protein RclHR1_02530008 [Rhizophagus clarus]|uniref:Uncharacterized protein n=1 Tax=Rhizophagus clarus TaxID=94130 RepID=A0A2Z6QYZ6_9GLOM|nr:hypothetical protein RclHR1_02530008 [Rhizophagus clarus]GES75649.1 hypothetical protein GLOIN_2v1704230 [Rhizophagus clarus]
MSNEQEITNSNGKLSSILNPTPTNDTSGQETSQDTQNNNKETTTTNGSGKTSQKIKKEFKYPQNSKEPSSSKNEGSIKTTTKPATKGSKQSKTSSTKPSAASSSKSKTSKNSRKRPLSPSDSEEGRETSQELERCQHPKHDEYMKTKPPTSVVNNKRAKLDKPPKLVGMPKRLEGVLNIDRGTKMCSRCINQTDKDPQYTSHKKYVSRKSVYKKNERSRLMIDMNGK